jgi:glycosyltransferase involved in cell wall biosynthesis
MRVPLVSILIPAFNAQEWVADSLRSAIHQTWSRKEIIVVDDGSTDRTLAVAREFESDIVRVVTQKNQGAAATRNKAFSLASGDYIQWLDADDLLAPDKIALQMNALNRCRSKRTLLSSEFGKFMYRWHRAQFIPTDLWRDLSPVEWLLCKMGQNLYMQSATWLVSRELSDAAGPWNTGILSDDDGEYFCRVLLQSDGTCFVPQARVYYRTLGSDSLSRMDKSDRKRIAMWDSMRLHVNYLRSLEDSPRCRAACLAYLQRRLDYFYPDRADIIKEVECLAAGLGGGLTAPSLSWKYSWIKALLGWDLAQHVSELLRRTKGSARKSWDKVLFHIENRKSAVLPRTNVGLGPGAWHENAPVIADDRTTH